MKIEKKKVLEDSNRDLSWTEIIFSSDDGLKKSKVLVCASQEYFEDSQELSGNQEISDEILDKWLNAVISKWSKLGEEIFEQDVHFDVYSNTQDGEANGLTFLLTKVK